MKILNYTLVLFCCLCSTILSAQTPHFINGSLEPPTTGFTATPCRNNVDLNVNTLGHVWKTVDKPDSMYVGEDACPTGSAKDGHYYLGLYYSKVLHKGNRIVLELDNTMLAGNTYSFFFYYKGIAPVLGTGASMEWGWTSLFDSVAGASSGNDSAVTNDNTWRRLNATVTPAINTKYVWVGAMPKLGNDSGIIYVDYFFMHYVGDHVEQPNANNEIQLYPNPFRASTVLHLSPAVALPCELVMYDLAGRVVIQQHDINQRKVPLSKANLQTGMYFLKLTDKERNTYQTKMIVE